MADARPNSDLLVVGRFAYVGQNLHIRRIRRSHSVTSFAARFSDDTLLLRAWGNWSLGNVETCHEFSSVVPFLFLKASTVAPPCPPPLLLKGPTVPEPFQLSKSNRISRERGGSAPGTPRSKEETLTFRESLARMENKVTKSSALSVHRPSDQIVHVGVR